MARKKKEEEKSLLDYYITAAIIAAKMDIGLEYAYRQYVKPTMPPRGGIASMRAEHIRMLNESALVN
jgi:hypothetical protein